VEDTRVKAAEKFSIPKLVDGLDELGPLPFIPETAKTRGKWKPERGILIRETASYFVALDRKEPQVSAGRFALPVPTKWVPYVTQPGLVVTPEGLRSPTPDEFILMLRGVFSTDKYVVSIGYLRAFFGPALIEMMPEAPAFIAQMNKELEPIGAELLFAVPAYLVHNGVRAADLKSHPGDYVPEATPIPYTDDMEGNCFASYAGAGWLVQCTMEDTAIGPLGVAPDGTFVASRHCQRVAPYDFNGKHVGERQFNFTENHIRLWEWLAGPGAEKYLGGKSLRKRGDTKGEPHAGLEELRAAVEAWSSAVQWERLTLAQAKGDATGPRKDENLLYYFAHQGRWYLAPFGAEDAHKLAVPVIAPQETIPNIQKLPHPDKLGDNGYLVSEPLLQAYYEVAKAVYKVAA
jgi:hypothetical protein